LVDVSKLAKEQIRKLSPCFHGGNLWRISEKYGIPLSQIIDFSVSINPLGTPEKAMKSIREHVRLVKNYPPPNAEQLIEKLAKYAGAKIDNIIVGNGTTEIIHTFVHVFLEKNQKTLIPAPTFGEYAVATLKAGGQPFFWKCDSETGFLLDLRKLADLISDDTKIVFLCNPNSPTGTLLKKSGVLDFIRKANDKNVLVFLDEAYFEFVEDEKRYSMTEYVEHFDNLFVLRSLTKFFGLSGLRIGFGVASPEMIELLRKGQVPWSVNTLAMFAAEAAVEDTAFIEKSRACTFRSKKQLQKLLQEIPWVKVYPSEANFFLCEIKKTNLTSAQVKDALERKGVLIRDCSNFEGLNNKFFRVAVKKSHENRKLVELLNPSSP
jgi:threonine-phosphate decarboxylase